jgi:hypothetical protein
MKACGRVPAAVRFYFHEPLAQVSAIIFRLLFPLSFSGTGFRYHFPV